MGSVYAKYAHPNNGHEHQQIEINGLLKVNEEYVVESVSMDSFHTDIFLRGISTSFNSVFFDFYESGKEIDIYMDPRFNPYIKERCNAGKQES